MVKKTKSEKSGSNSVTILLLFMFLLGIGILCYPSFSNAWNSTRQTKAITEYKKSVNSLSEKDYSDIWEAAQEYNETLTSGGVHYNLNPEEKALYQSLLNVSTDSHVMGEIEIPSIDVELPVSHGTDEFVLRASVGHIEWSSLPTGGLSTHCVLSGHRGLPSATLFTYLDELCVGDCFILSILDKTFTYEVDQILVVEPNDVKSLEIIPGEDLCTLVTCTPYGINTHRLLVRGHRIPNVEKAEEEYVTSEKVQLKKMLLSPLFTILIILIILLFLAIYALILNIQVERKKDKQKKS